MKQYKHYSFDLWQTLIKSNPLFRQKRAEYFHSHFNRDNKSIQEIQDIISDIDKMVNIINEKTGCCMDALEMYAMLLFRLNYDMKHLLFRDLMAIYHITDQLFFDNPPSLYDEDTQRVLEELKKRGATISILSNTAFVRGTTLKRFLHTNDLWMLVDFEIYSDEAGLSKPNEHLFRHLLQYVHALRKHHPVRDTEIVHVGDSLSADIEGAKRIGIDAIQINSNDKTITHLLA